MDNGGIDTSLNKLSELHSEETERRTGLSVECVRRGKGGEKRWGQRSSPSSRSHRSRQKTFAQEDEGTGRERAHHGEKRAEKKSRTLEDDVERSFEGVPVACTNAFVV